MSGGAVTPTAVAVEPSAIGYDLYCQLGALQGSVDFLTFVKGLNTLFAGLATKNLKIACTGDLFKLLAAQIPYSRLRAAGQHGLVQVATEAYYKRLPNYLAFSNPDRACFPTIEDGISDPGGLLANDDTFREWRFILGLILHDELPTIVVKGGQATIFSADRCRVSTGKDTVLEVSVTEDVCSRELETGIALWRLSQLTTRCSGTIVPCSGTGTHASMWGHKIRSMQDVPNFERELLQALADTGLVEEFKLLDFNQRKEPVDHPHIELFPLADDELDSNLILGRLRGQGTRNHAQNISLRVRSGVSRWFCLAFGEVIDLIALGRLGRIVQRREETGAV